MKNPHDWTYGKPWLSSTVALEGVSASNPIAELLRQNFDNRFNSSSYDIKKWISFYKHQDNWAISLFNILNKEDKEPPLTSKCWQQLRRMIGFLKRATLEEIRKAIEELGPDNFKLILAECLSDMEKLSKAQREGFNKSISEEITEQNVRKKLLTSIEGAFYFQVWVPCFIYHKEYPFKLFRLARCGHAESLRKLLLIDKSIIHDHRISQHIFDASRKGGGSFHSIAKAFASKPKPLKAKKVKVMIAAYLTEVFSMPQQKLSSPQIREAYDLVAKHENDGKVLRDLHLHDSDESLLRAIERERKGYAGLCGKPDKKRL